MDKAINSDVLRLLVILLAGSIGAYLFLIGITKRVIGSSKRLFKKQNFYLIIGALLFGLTGLTGHRLIFGEPSFFLVAYQGFFLALGILHYYLMNKMFPMDQAQKGTFGLELSFTLCLALFGFLLFFLIFRYFNRSGLHFIISGSLIFFLIPFLFFQTYKRAVAIPPKTIQLWYYPIQQQVAEPSDIMLKNMLLVSFKFQKKAIDPHLTTFRAKAPVDMPFGDLFYYFINDFNETHQDEKIQYTDEAGILQGWVFSKKRKWHQFTATHINTTETIAHNKIKENDIIVCSRIF